MQFALELKGYNKMPYKTKAIVDVLQRNLGGDWVVREVPSEPVPDPISEQVFDYCQAVIARAVGSPK